MKNDIIAMNISLPNSLSLPIQALASSFDNVTNSYKFYWFLAILESIRKDEGRVIPVHALLARMAAMGWYPINYYRLSFGKQDQLGNVITLIMERSGITLESTPDTIANVALDHLRRKDDVGEKIKDLANFVPYRFLRPFFTDVLRGEDDWKINRRIQELAEQSFYTHQPCLYRFVNFTDNIEIHPDWYSYLQKHLAILTGFCLWHLINYLQKHNPNVPGIAGKLFKPQSRNLLQARSFWNLVLRQVGSLTCIYSGKPIFPGKYSIDHFLPWRFVAHDLLWNLIPAPKEVNASKNDNLPDPSYLEPFAGMQYQAVQSVACTAKAEKFLEDYVVLFKVSSVEELQKMSFGQFRDSLQATIAPQLQVAANMGFSANWKYRP